MKRKGHKSKPSKSGTSNHPCTHRPNPDQIPSPIRYPRCQECRIEKRAASKRAGSGNSSSNHSGPDHIWICLSCNRTLCGGGNPSDPSAHSRRHAKLERHHLAVRSDRPAVCWCFPCNSLVTVNTPPPLTQAVTAGYAVRGMVNLGNTCFFNSVMQNLLAMSVLRDCMVSVSEGFGPLTVALKGFFVESGCGEGVLDPSTLFGCVCVKAAQFRGFEQQDSHELLRYLLDCLQSEVSVVEEGTTFVDTIFGGQLTSTVSCMECGHTSVVNEPFLDLSLSVPSKKPPAKRVPASRGKRNKPPPREGSRRRKVRAKEIPISDLNRAESSSFPSECNQSYVPSSEQKQTVVMGVDDSSIGVPCDGPPAMVDTTYSVSQNCDVHVAQSSGSGEIDKGEDYVKCTSDRQIYLHSTEPVVSSDSCGASFCRDGNSSACTQDSGVVSIPRTGLDSVVDTNKMSQKRENMASVGSPVIESCAQTTVDAGCDQAQVVFDGLGDLFNEPEVTSDLRTDTGMGKEMDITLLAGNSHEPSQDEVDDTTAPLSLESCLALFTKQEVLSDEHAWHCESCSESFPDKITEHRSGKRQTLARPDHSEALNPHIDEGEVANKKLSPGLEVDFMEATEFKVSGNLKMRTNLEDLVLHIEGIHNPHIDVDASQNPVNPIQQSTVKTCKDVLDENNKSFNASNPLFSDSTFYHNVLQKDEDVTESDHNSQFVSCPSAHEDSLLQEKSSHHDSDSCSTNDQKSIGCGGQDLAPVSDGLPDQTETNPQSSCENDNFSEVNQVGKTVPKVLDKMHPTNDSEGEEMEIESRKIKRDATRRTLIDRAPPILTIHLKRFRQDARGRFNKLRGHVSFQEILDLRPYMDPRSGEKENCCYRLVGLVEHSGTMTRGHYVAYVRGERLQQKAQKGNSPAWFYASDAHVREVPLSEVLSSEAYILFYERVPC